MRPCYVLWRRFASVAVFVVFPILLGALCITISRPVSAQTTIIVTTTADELDVDGNCSLREAIEAANQDIAVDACIGGSGNDIISVPAGIYTITLANASDDTNEAGDYDITSNLSVLGSGVSATEISGGAIDRIIHVHPGATVRITGLALRDGAAGIGGPGGAVLNEGALSLDACSISMSISGSGQDCSNTTGSCQPNAGNGGGVYNSGVLTITNSQIRYNNTGKGGNGRFGTPGPSYPRPDGSGGGVYNAGVLVLTSSEVEANQGYRGGGIYNEGQTIIIATVVFSNHTKYGQLDWYLGNTSGHGGGIANNYGGLLNMSESAIYNNWTPNGGPNIGRNRGGFGGDGGGVYNLGVMTSTNNTIARNWTGSGGDSYYPGIAGNGGGICNGYQGTLALDHTTIVANATGTGGSGLYEQADSGYGAGLYISGATYIKNSLLADNRAGTSDGMELQGSIASDCLGLPVVTYGYNLISAKCEGADATTDRQGVAPLLAPFGYYGGPTQTYALLKLSPAIDKGSCTDIEQKSVSVDQRGVLRPQLNNCDIGAYEALKSDSFSYVFLPIITVSP